MAEPRLDPVTGLSRYRPDGVGIPPETEASHFTHILEPYAEKHGAAIALGNIVAAVACRNEMFLRAVFWVVVKLFQKVRQAFLIY